MTIVLPVETPLSAATFRQREVSDPAVSAWLVANAGAGKTHVLAARVTRLLLSGSNPGAILCLTYTRAAAAEMGRRVFGRLGTWATLPDDALTKALAEIDGMAPASTDLRAARRLFARALETPGGLKLQTIHAFCERVLQQFPFEANVPGHFAVLDESLAASLKAQAMEAAYADPRLRPALARLATAMDDGALGGSLDALLARADRLLEWLARHRRQADDGLGDLGHDLRARFRLDGAASRAEIADAFLSGDGCAWLREEGRALLAALEKNPGASNDAAAGCLRTFCHGADPVHRAEALVSLLLPKDGSPRSPTRTVTRAVHERFDGFAERFMEGAGHCLALLDRWNALAAVEASESLLLVADGIIARYAALKRREGALDFDDLIHRTRTLLSHSDAALWVLRKLDAGIDHILIDEAQDSNPAQWQIVKSLSEDFFAGDTARRPGRTVFAVGDEKQSIYGFQGAAPAMLSETRDHFERKATAAGHAFKSRPIGLSFRSAQDLLDAVDRVFKGDLAKSVTHFDYVEHVARDAERPGRVVIWPRERRVGRERPADWTTPLDAPEAAETALAEAIAAEIQRLVDGDLRLPSGRAVGPDGILVLAARRGAFFDALDRALRARRLPTAGADRIALGSHLATRDLLALVETILLPDDDLSLAALLKCPLFGFSDDDLFRLAHGRGRRSLFSVLVGSDFPADRAAAERLARFRAMADQVTPFAFLARVLGPEGGRKRFRARLGPDVDEVLDELLDFALAAEAGAPPSLQGFAARLKAFSGDRKREADDRARGVRIMTVHGAKGLEAEVVFLVDGGGGVLPPGRQSPIVPISGGADAATAFFLRQGAKAATEHQRRADAVAREEAVDEYRRLLYVGMTRAKDVLYVCGVKAKRTPDDCWWRLVADRLVPPSAERDEEDELAAPFQFPETPRGAPAAAVAAETAKSVVARPVSRLPDWAVTPAGRAPELPAPLRPSAAIGGDERAPDEADGGSAAELTLAIRRGRAIHRLLELLPALDPTLWDGAADRFLREEWPTDPEMRRAVAAEVRRTIRLPALAPLFGPGARAEVPIVGHVETAAGRTAVSGQIDRLAITADSILVADFKTGRAVPDSAENIPERHVAQLALYVHLLERSAARGRPVQALVVYTAAGRVFALDPTRIAAVLDGLGIRGAATERP